MVRPSYPASSSSAASSPMSYISPHDTSCRSPLLHTWTLRGKAYWPQVRRRIEHSYSRLADWSGLQQARRRKERRSGQEGDVIVLPGSSGNRLSLRATRRGRRACVKGDGPQRSLEIEKSRLSRFTMPPLVNIAHFQGLISDQPLV